MVKNLYPTVYGLLSCLRRGETNKLYQKVAIILLLMTVGGGAAAQISGTVYRDFNADGVRSFTAATPLKGEIGVGGVTVTIYSGTAEIARTVSSTVTATAGQYSISTSATGPFRVVFSNLPTGFFATRFGADNGTTVQFAPDNTTAGLDLGINNPNDYCQSPSAVQFAVPCYENGSGVGNTNPAFVTAGYNNSGTTVGPDDDFQTQTLGTVWGVAYQRRTKQLFTSAFLKRHAGLGPRGADGVYRLNYSGATPTVASSVDLQGVTPSNGGSTIDLGTVTRTNTTALSTGAAGDNQLPADRGTANVDLDAFAKVGKISYGGIDLTEDEDQLWLVNLNQRSLIRIDATNPALLTGTLPSSLVNQYRITQTTGQPSILGAPSCTNGTLRPFALKFYRGRGYLGCVCDAAASTTVRQPAGLTGYVLSFDPTNPTSFTTELTIPLNYNREPAYKNGTNNLSGVWQRWTDTWGTDLNGIGIFGDFRSAPQPILADIEFAEDGSMVLGFADRFSHQGGARNYAALSGDRNLFYAISAGDLIKATRVGSTYQIEAGEADPGAPPSNPSYPGFLTNDGPTGAGEFYWGDYYQNFANTAGEGHYETATGGLAILPGANEVTSTVMDPTSFFSQGVRWFNQQTGAENRSYLIVTSGNSVVSFGKASDLGDIELLCDLAPIEIGNRLFNDGDFLTADGIQGNNNTGSNVSGATVLLYRVGTATPVASTTTNSNGEYYFNNTNVTGGLLPNTAYEVRVSLNQFAFPTTITRSNVGADDLSDSDALLQTIGGVPTAVVSLTTGDYGENNHSYDIGFIRAPATIGDFVFEDLNRNGLQDTGEPGLAGVTVQLLDASGNPVSGVASVTTTSTGFYSLTGLTPATPYIVAFTRPTGYTATLADQGANDAIDSDVNPTTGRTISYTVASGASLTTVDAGFYRSASVGDRVFVDADRDGVQDAGEVGLAGVTVQLLTGTNTVVASTTTNATGLYSFTGLTPGVSYTVVFTRPTGYTASAANLGGNDALDSDADPVTGRTTGFTLTSGQSLTTVDAGFDLLDYDLALRKTVLTQPSPVLPGSNVTFRIEVFNQGELAASGITVTDYVPAGFVFNAGANPGWTGTTNPTFPLSGTLTPGTSTTISIVLQTAASSGGQSLTNAAEISVDNGDDLDSTPDNVATNDGTVTDDNIANLNGDQDDHDIAVVTVVSFATLGNLVFEDLNRNGLQDTGEPGIGGVTVQLLTGTSTVVSTTTTNASGIYSFTGLTPGVSYSVAFGQPTGYTATLANQGANDAADSDADPATGRTGAYVLTAGQNNVEVDAGFYRSASLGDRVFADTDRDGIQDAGEPGISGATVQLLTGAGTVVATVTTNATGLYSFTGLTPGVSYTVVFTRPTGYTASAANQGGDDTVDSDADPATGRTGAIVLTSNQSLTTVDAGFSCIPPVVTATGGVLSCSLTSVQLQATSSLTPATFAWTGPGGFTSTAQNPTVSAAGTYTVVVTSNAGCSATAVAIAIVTLDNTPPANVVATNTGPLTCTLTTATISATSSTTGVTYRWVGPGGFTSTAASFPTSIAGLYSVTVTSTNGCTATASTTLQQDITAPTVTATNTGPLTCTLTTVTVGASSPTSGVTYRWAGPGGFTSTAASFPVGTAGVYSVTATAPNGCTAVTTTTVGQNITPPTITATNTGPLTCTLTSVTVSVNPISGATYRWVGPGGFTSTVASFSVSTSGVYSVTVTAANGCTAVNSTTVQQDATAPTVTASNTGPLTCTLTSVNVVATASPGVTYRWLGPGGFTSTASTAPVSASGVYSVTVTSANGCTATASTTVTQDLTTPQAVTASNTGPLTCTLTTVTVSVTTTTANVTYRWVGPNGFTSIAASFPTSVAGLYSVTVTSANGCTATASTTVTQDITAPTVTATNTGPLTCTLTNVNVVATASPGVTYRWAGPGGFTSTASTAPVSASGVYSVTVTSANGCTATASTTVGQSIAPPAGVLASNTGPLTCTLTTATVSVTTTTTNVTYRWVGPGGFTSTVASFPVSTSGAYSVTVTSANGCTATASTTVTQDATVPTITATNTGPLTCTLTSVNVVATASPGVTYRWSSGQTTASFTTSLAGVYSVTVTAANGCTATASTTVTQDVTTPQAVAASNTGPLTCALTTATVSVTTTTANVTYRWVGPNGFTSTAASFNTSTAGLYSVTVTSANGCTAVTTTTVTQDAAIPTGVSASNTGPLTCTLISVTVSATSTTAGVTYRWTGPGGFVSSASSFPTTIAGIYSVTVTNPVNGCFTTTTTTVGQDNAAPAGVSAGNTGPLTCTALTATISVTTTTAGVIYRWVGPSGFTSTAASFSTSIAGLYSVTVTSANGCTATASTTLQQNITAPTVTATNNGPLSCTLGTVTVAATASEAVSYRWSTGATTPTISVSAAGTYSVTVTSANGCTATTSSTVQQDLTAPTVVATNTGPLTCSLTTVNVSATANESVTFRWNIGVSTAGFTTSVAGLYSVTATAANGCTAVATTTVQQDLSVPTVTASNTGPLTCTLTTVTVSANASPGVTYRWSTGATTPTISVSAAGTYSVTVTSANGCIATASSTVGQDINAPAGVVASNNGPLNCAQATATVNVSSTTPGVTYRWAGLGGFTAVASSFTVNVAGVYSVTVTSPNGCTTVAATNVVQNTTPLAGVAASNTGPLTCTLATVTVSVTATTPGVTYSWTGPGGFTSTAQSFTTGTAGTYVVTVSGPNGCAPAVVSTVVGLDNTAPANVTATNTGPLSCTLNNVTVTASSSTPGVTYRWVGPGGATFTTASFATAAAGLYSVTVTSANGCTAGATTTVGQDNTGVQDITISNTGPLTCTLTTVTVNASSSTPGVTYRWVGPSGFTSVVPSFNTTVAGTYSLTLSAPNGCSAATSTTVLLDNFAPADVLASNTGPLTCTLTTATVSVTTTTAGVIYRWLGPGGFTSTASSFTANLAGTYSVTLTGTNGCTAVSSTVLSQSIAPPAGVAASNTGPLTCTLTTVTVSASSTTGGVLYSWVGPGGFTSTAPSFATSLPGTYSVTITNTANGCTTTASTSVGQDVTVPANVTATNTGPLTCTLTTVTVSASSATPGVTHRWVGPGGFTSTDASFPTSVAGLYSVTVTSANGCTVVVSTIIQQDLTVPTVTATNTGPLTCTLTSAVVTASSSTTGLSYRWSSGQTAASFSTSISGTYSVTVTSANGCTATASTTVQIDQTPPTVTASNTGPLTCTLTSVNVSATANEAVTYRWVGPGGATFTTASFATAAAGLYSVTVTSANGCTATASTTVQQNNAAPTVTATNTGPFTCTLTTVTLTTTPSGPVTYLWSTGATTASTSVSVAGLYSVTVTSANGCTATTTTSVVSDTATPMVTASVSNTITVNQPAATISTVATPGVSYLWSTGATTPTISVSAAGTYSVTVTSANGCTALATTTVVSDTAAPAVTASVSNTLTCAQPTATLSTTVSGGVVGYAWSTGETNASIVVNVAGLYSVTVTAANGATAVATTTVVSDTATPTLTASVSNTLTCTQPTATISTTATPGVSYVWSTGATTPAIAVSAAGPYSVTVTASNGCFTSVTTTVVSDTATPTVTASVSNTITVNQPTATLSTTVSGGVVSYVWSTGGTTPTISVSAAGAYSVTVTSANGCTAVATTTVVSDTAAPSVTASVSNTLTCAQPTATISTTVSGGVVSYLWSTGETTPGIVVSAAGTYSVTVTAANGATAVATTTVVSDTAVPTLTASVSNTLTCTQPTATISTTATPGVSYAWSTGATTPSITVNVAGLYSVTVTSANGCTAVTTSVVEQNIAPPAGVLASNTGPLNCTLTTATVSVTSTTPGVTYRWAGPGGFTSTAASFPTSVAGLYSVTVTGANGCTATAATTIQQNQLAPTVTATNTGPLTCTLNTVTVSATTSELVTYQWSSGQTTASFSTGISGVYSVTVTSANGCTATASTTVQEDRVTPNVTATNTGPLTCTLNTVTVSATTSELVTYQWSSGQTTASFSTSLAGTYSVTVTAVNGCTAVSSTTVQENRVAPNVTVNNTGPLNCTLTSVTITEQPDVPATYLWSTGETTPAITVSTAGPYSITVTAANGCTATTTTTVVSDTATPVVTASVSNTLTVNQPAATISTVATPGVSYLWSTGATTPTISVSAAGTYSVTVTSANGCTAVATTTVFSDTAAPTLTASVSNTLTCAQPTATISTTATPGVNYLWSTGETNASIVVNAAGLYSVTVTATNGATAVATTTVFSNTVVPTVTASVSNTLTCAQPTAIISTTATPGVSYVWSNGATTPLITVNAAGTYSVTVTSANGCFTSVTTTVVSDTATPTVTASVSNTITVNQPTATLSTTVSGGVVSYVWSTGATTPTISVSAAGTYSVTVTSANGCTAVATTVVVSDTAAPSVTASVSNTLTCSVLTATIATTVSGGVVSYVWSNGATSPIITVSTAGVYSVTVTGANGATAVTTTTVVSDTATPAVTASVSNTITVNQLTATISTVATPGVSYVWSTGATTPTISVSASGVYSVTVTSANGCTAAATTTVISDTAVPLVNASVSNVLTCAQATATATISTTATPANVTYLWSTGETTPSIAVSVAGTYSVTVTAQNGATASVSIPVISDTSVPTVTALASNTLSCGQSTATINTTTASGATYEWSTGETTASISVSVAGAYSVTVTGSNGCTAATTTTVVSDTATPAVSASVSNVLNCTAATATISTSISTGSAATYLWSTGATTPSITVSVAGPYSVTVTSANGCTALATTAVVSDTAVPTVTASVSNTITVAQPAATISTTASAGVSYAWSTGQTTPSIVVNSAGTYSVTVTSANGCTAAVTTTVVSDTAIPTVAASVSNELSCTALTATISTTATPGVSYVWSNGAITPSITVSVAGPYSVTVTAQNGARASVTTTVVSDTAVPVVTASVSNTLTCTQPTATISTSAGVGSADLTYAWSTGATTASISVSAAGTYSVTVTSANGCFTSVTTTVVSDTATPTVTASVSNTITVNQPTATLSTTVSGGVVSYVWSTGATTPTISVSAAGTYSVTVTSANGCTAVATTVVVSDTAAPSVTASVSNTLTCSVLTATIATTVSGGVVSYLWSTGETTPGIVVSAAGTYSVTVTAANGATAVATTTVVSDTAVPTLTASVSNTLTCTQPTATISTTATPGISYVWSNGDMTPSITVSASGVYSVTVTSANGCTAVTTTTVVSDTAIPTVTASVSNTITVAQPAATISTTASAGVSYAWSTGQTTPSIVVNSAGTYSVTVTSANGCTAAVTTTVVSDTAIPTVAASVSNELSCTALTATISTTATPGVSYVWSNGAITPTITVSTAGPYSVTVTAQNGARASVTTTVVSDTAVPVVTASVSNTLTCTQPTATISTSAGVGSADLTYAWSTGATTASISVSVAGTYSATVTGSNGCTVAVTTTVVSDTATPTVTASVSNTLTVTQPTAIISTTASADVSYAWSTGQTTPSIVVNSAGLYSVTVTSANGCTAATTTTVLSDTALPTVSVTVSNDLSCTALTATISTTATPGVSYVWSNGAITPSITVSVAGPYSVTVTAQNGARASISTAVFSDTATPTVTAAVSNLLSSAQPTATITTTVDAAGPVTYQWNTGETTLGISVSAAGTYSVTVTASNGCTAATTTTVVSDTAVPVVTASVSNTLTCSALTATISTTASPGVTYAWSTGATTPTISVSAAGTYSVTVTAVNGATAVATTVVVSDTATPTVTASASNTLTVSQPTAILSTTVSGGVVSYVWSNGATTPTISVSAAGPYSVTVTGSNGCTAMTTTTVVSDTALPSVTASVSNDLSCTALTATISTTASPGVSYVWSTGATTTSISVSVAGAYSVTVIGANGATAVATATVISDTAVPTVTASVSNPLTCAQPTATISTSVGVGSTDVSYVWSTGATTPTISVSAVGTYSVTVTGSNGCTAVTTATVTATGLVPPVLTPVSASLCVGLPLNLTAVLASGTGNDLTGLTSTLLGGAALPTNLTVGAGETVFNVVSTNPVGCTAATTITIVGVDLPVLTPISASLCVGAVLDLTDLVSNVPASFTTIFLNSAGIAVTNPAAVTIGAGENLFTAVSTNALGCSVVAPIRVTGVATPVLTPVSLSLCAAVGATVNLNTVLANATGLSGLNNVFRIGTGTSGAIIADPTAVSLAAGANVFTAVSTNGTSCSSTTQLTIVLNPVPVLPPVSVSLCAPVGATVDLPALLAGATSLSGLTTVFRAGDATGGIIATPSAVSLSAGVNPFTAIGTNGFGCADTTQISVNLLVQPVVSFGQASQTICMGIQPAPIVATVLSGTVVSSQFFGPLTTTTGSLGVGISGATSLTFTPTAAQLPALGQTRFFALVTTGAPGCSDTTFVSVTVNPQPVATVASVSICLGQLVNLGAQLTAQPGTTSAFYATALDAQAEVNPLVNLTISPAVSTTFFTRVTLPQTACFRIDSIRVTVNAKPSADADQTLVCNGDGSTPTSTTLAVVSADAGTWSQLTGESATIASPNSATTSVSSLTAGSYSFVFTTVTGCSDTVNVTVPVCQQLGSIGDFVWNDLNNNGRQDAGEPGVDGVLLALFVETTPGQFTSVSSVVTQTVNGQAGFYTFTGLATGNYRVQLDKTTLPTSFSISPNANQTGVPDNLDSDFDPASGFSTVVAINTALPIGSLGRNNPTVDAAITSQCPPVKCVPFVIQRTRTALRTGQ